MRSGALAIAASEILFTTDGKRILTASRDAKVRIWDAATSWEIISVLREKARCSGCISVVIDDGNETIETVDGFGDRTRFELSKLRRLDSTLLIQPGADVLLADSITHSILASFEDGTVKSTAIGNFPVHSALVSQAIFLKDGRVVTGEIDGSIRVIDPTKTKLISSLDVGESSLQYCLRFAGLLREAIKGKKAVSATVTGNTVIALRSMVMKQAIEYNLAGVASNKSNAIVTFTLQGDAGGVDEAIASIHEAVKHSGSNIMFNTTEATVDPKLNSFTILAWTAISLNITNPYDLVFSLRPRAEKILKADAMTVWGGILTSTLKGKDLEKWLAAN